VHKRFITVKDLNHGGSLGSATVPVAAPGVSLNENKQKCGGGLEILPCKPMIFGPDN